MRERIAVLGATGSIGEQTLEVIRLHPERFEVAALTARTGWKRLVELAREFEPGDVVIADESLYEPLRRALADRPGIRVSAGEDAVAAVAEESGIDVVVNAIVGYAGLMPTVRAAGAGKKIALANKESLVVAGELVMRLAAERGVAIMPVDSEHSAVFQCLAGEVSPVRRIILTASGGALRDVPLTELAGVTAERALSHPNWKMGSKITIDSATMVNKGFEVIEAQWLFGLEAAGVDVLIHPDSIVHSLVEFEDGAMKAQLGTPDMRVPIAYALSYPERLPLPAGFGRLELERQPPLSFAKVDGARYPAFVLAREAMAAGGTACCTLNAANEVAVAAFLEGRIGFLDIERTIRATLESAENVARPALDDYIHCNIEARRAAESFI